ncbi:serine/threonine receptor-like kinase NFP [Neltuma alba]|uniref:serine/threonine receptor-like kinase NFP n=1 Tax=Neltuma alba TaxID=207710 RepID=UPI0010A4FF72|nr:serine/threonine receptor-like kinase NFP [Prosopis alba]
MMRIRNSIPHHLPLFFFLLLHLFHPSQAQDQIQPNTTGYQCPANQTGSGYPCRTYAFYQASAPNFLDLASIGDLFSVSRPMIAQPSNISSPNSTLAPNQPLFVPLFCSCNFINSTFGAISYANLSYTIKKGDTFYQVSSFSYRNLTTYQSVEVVNPTLIPTNLTIGVSAVFPVFCKCPNTTQLRNGENILISYVVQPNDNVSSIATMFGSKPQSIIDANRKNFREFDTIFVPVSRLPVLTQLPVNTSAPPASSPAASVTSRDRTGTVRGLAIGLGIVGLLLILVLGLWVYREALFKDKLAVVVGDEEKHKQSFATGTKGSKEAEAKLMANVSDCLDKYRVFGYEELREATNGFDQRCLILGSVYKGTIDGEVYAIKKMKWNAYEELKILQKVNHGNLVKLEGFCIDDDEANCYLVYEYVENGSLYSWLHEDRTERLNWKMRLHVAIDVANGLQYIHEHTRPRVVHKDIKSSNILLDANMRAKIANFGLAKSGMNAITMHIVGTQGYIAPEYLADGVVSTKMDVFSFGVVLLELITGKEAIDDRGNPLWTTVVRAFELGSDQEKNKRLREWLDSSLLRETCSMESLRSVLNVALACLHKDPTKRPSMVDVVYALSKSEDSGFDTSDDTMDSPLVSAR